MKLVFLIISFLFITNIYFALDSELANSNIESSIIDSVNNFNINILPSKDSSTNIFDIISSFGALLAALVALYLGVFKILFERPKLKIKFENAKPYLRRLAFEPYNSIINLDDSKLIVYRPGINVRIKVLNTGKTLAKNVKARLEKIVFYDDKNSTRTKFYHPADLKWSGLQNWEAVDIAPNSFFFLDALWIKNETLEEVYSFNNQRYENLGLHIDDKVLKNSLDKKILLNKKIYWNTWVDCSFKRGIPTFYEFEGKFHLNLVINGSNCKPVGFILEINWEKSSWDKPKLKVVKN